MWNTRLDEAQAGIKIAGRNSNSLIYTDDTTLMAESEELNSLLMTMKKESEKAGLKLNVQKMKIMTFGPITSQQIDGETMETVSLYLLGLKKKKKQRHYFTSKGPSHQSYVFSSSYVWMWELDQKAEHRRIDAFELWCWRRLLRVPWTARSNQSILKEISPKYSLEGMILKLKLQYFGHMMCRTDALEKSLMLGKVEGRRRRGWQRMRWLDGKLWAMVKDREAWQVAVHGDAKS